MKFKIDENLPGDIVLDLRAAGHEADSVLDEGLGGAPDSTIMAQIQVEQRAIITLDKGIADVRTYPPTAYAGLILLRPRSTGRQATLDFVRKHLPALLQSKLVGHLFVVTENGIRVR
jgi:predicted nuclease of predicted toxin-antitoxin system